MLENADKPGAQNVLAQVSDYLTGLKASIDAPVRVREEELAGRLGVSRTPVREALIRLDTIGLVSLRPGKGALLAPTSDAEYLEWLQIREQLEGLATREAAMNATRRDVDHLRAIFAPFMDPGEAAAQPPGAYAKANVDFHQEIVRLSGNALLVKMWALFGHLQTSHRRQTIARLHRQDDSMREHLEIIDAIHRRDADGAEDIARRHVRSLLKAFAAATPT